MHFLDAWTSLSFLDQLGLVAPAALMIAAIVLPGQGLTALLALALAPATALGMIPGGWLLRAGWGALWLTVAFTLTRSRPPGVRRPVERAGGFESTLIALMLGVPMFALLTVAIARQDLSVPATRAATAGALYVSIGIVHLMVRRHILRSSLGWAFTGFGLQVLAGATLGALPEAFAPPAGAVLVATAVTVALVLRLGLARGTHVGSAWLSDAHDLHD